MTDRNDFDEDPQLRALLEQADPARSLTPADPEGLARLLPKLTNLWKLSLDRTAIGDRALLAVEKLSRLEAVNLYATQVTDAGLKPLEKLPRLRSVYAWQTQVTPQGAEALQTTSKKVHVNIGAPPAPAIEMTKDEKAPAK